MRKSTRFPSASRRVQPRRTPLGRTVGPAQVAAVFSALTLGAAIAPHAWAQQSDAWSTAPVDGTFTGINWTTGTTTPGAPTGTIASGDNLYFGTSSITTLNNDEAAGFGIGSFNFNVGASAYTITGNSFALGAAGITNNSTSLQTINDAFTLAATSAFTTTTGGGNLALGGVISGVGGITVAGTGITTLNAINTFSGGTTVNGGTLALGAGGGTAAVQGTVTINAGATLNLTATDALGYAAGQSVTALNVNGGTVNSSVAGNNGFLTNFNLTGGTVSSTGGGKFFFGGAGTSLTSNASATTSVFSAPIGIQNTALTITTAAGSVANGGADLAITGVISVFDTNAGTGIVKAGSGTLALTGANTYTGGTAVNAGTLAGTTIGLQGNVTDTTAVIFDQTLPVQFGGATIASGTYAGVISGAGTVAKNNAGIVILSGANTYTGATAINGGILYVNGSLATASAVSVASGARLGGTGTVGTATIASGGSVEGGQNKAGTLTLSGLTFNGTATAFFGNLSNYTTTPAIAAGALTTTGANSVALTINGTIPGAGTYQLISYTGGAIGGTGQSAFTLGTLPNRATGNLVFTTGLIALNVTGSDFLIWTGGATNTWDTTNPNFKLNSNGQAATYINNPGDSVVFDDTAGAAHTTVNLNSGNLTPTSVTFNNSALNYTLQGASAITGVTGLTKTGTGTLTITNANTYTGLTAINGGILSLGNAGAVGTTGTISFGGGTLQYTASNTTDYSGRFSTAANQAYSIDTNGQAVTFATALGSAGGSLTKSGTGALTLSAFETYTGGTIINGGTLTLTKGGGAGNVQGVVTVNAGGTLNLAAGDAIGYNADGTQVTTLNVNGGTVNNSSNGNEGFRTNLNLTGGAVTGGGILRFNNATAGSTSITSNASAVSSTIAPGVDAFNGPLNINVASGTVPSGVDLLISGPIYTNSIVKTGAGYLNLTGQGTFTGPVTVSAGRLNIGASSADNGSSGPLGLSNNGKTITVSAGATLSGTNTNWFGNQGNTNLPTITVNGGTITAARYTAVGPLNLNAASMVNTDTTDTGNYQSFALRGNVTVGGAAASTISTTAASATTGGVHLGTNTVFTVADATGNSNVDLTVSAPLRNVSGDFGAGAGGFTKAGPGTMVLSGANTYTGPTAVNVGTLLVNGSTAAGAVTVGTTGATPTTGILGGTGTIAGATTVNAGSTITGADVGTVGALTLQSTVTLTGGTYVVDISGATADKLTITGALTLTNANITFNGTPTAASYVLATFASETGTFAGTAPSGYTFQFNANGTELDLTSTAVPEPATWMAGCLLVGLTGLSQRRKVRTWLTLARG